MRRGYIAGLERHSNFVSFLGGTRAGETRAGEHLSLRRLLGNLSEPGLDVHRSLSVSHTGK